MPQTLIMVTRSGQEVWYEDPSKTKIINDDLYFHLKRECRYCGAIPVPVLDHLYNVVRLAELWFDGRAIPAYAAAHDLHEAYVKDIPSPMKEVLGDAYRRLEGAWEVYVHYHFGLEFPPSEEIVKAVKKADLRALTLESYMYGLPLTDHLMKKHGRPTKEEITIVREGMTLLRSDQEAKFRYLLSAIETYKEEGE